MIEWLLTDSNLYIATFYGILGSASLGSIILVSLPYEKNPTKYQAIGEFSIISIIMVPLIILLTAIFIHNETKLEYTSDSEWKTIYENNIDAEIILNLKTENGYLISNAIAGKSIEKDYKDYSQNNNMDGTILAKKDDIEENKTIHINKEDIIYDGELKPTSKITKIEYRPAQQMYKTVFGYNGKPKSANIDGLVRITISDDNSPERNALKSLFTN